MKNNRKMTVTAISALTLAATAGLLSGIAKADSGVQGISNSAGNNSIAAIAGMNAGVLNAEAGKHDCKGKNECKGQGGCKSGDNGCHGKNTCKGKGGCASK